MSKSDQTRRSFLAPRAALALAGTQARAGITHEVETLLAQKG
jgi:hypothetical protein